MSCSARPLVRSVRRRSRRSLAVAAAAGATLATPLLVVLVPQRAGAINITMTYNNGSSIEPAADATGANLTAIMNYVATYYEDIFQDAHNLTINFWWDNAANFTNPTGTLASHSLVSQGGAPNRETSANIRFNNSFTWFFDGTPDNDSEFTMTQRLWRDLTNTQRTNDFNWSGTIPETFEVGFSGAADAGEGATGATDVLSVAFHEVGHALGMSASNNSTIAQTNDNDYDFNPAFVFGQTLAAETATTTDEAHVDLQFGLMQPSIGQGTRRRPGHADLFAMASGSFFTNLDVPRREAYGGFDWNTASNWSGNAVPHSNDEVHVRNPGFVVVMSLSANGVAEDLFLEEGAWITTNFKLDVTDDTTVGGTGTRMRIQSDGELETADLFVEDAGTVDLIGGLVDVLGSAVVNAGAFVEGYGTIQAGSGFRNEGTLRANDSNGNLVLTTAGAGVWDLDGTGGNGVVEATSGNITITGTLNDAFDGVMTVSSSRTITFNSGWTLGAGGLLTLNGTSAVASIGGTSTIDGNIVVNGDGRFTGAVTFNSGASVALSSGDVLSLNGTTTYSGGSYTGAGTLAQNGNATIAANTTIDVDTLDWDGTDGLTVTTINDAVTLTINSNVVDIGGATFGGTININGGTLAVNTTNPWSMGGAINLATATGSCVVNGSGINISGSVTATGGNVATFNAPVTFSSAATVNVTSGTDLVLNVATFNGGTYTGLGEITQSDDWVVGTNTTIGTSTLDWGNSALLSVNSITINSGATLTVNSTSLGSAGNDFRGILQLDSGDLVVNTGPWTLPAGTGSPFFTPGGTLNLNNTGSLPSVGGQPLTVGGTVTSTGLGSISANLTYLSTANVSVPLVTDILAMSGTIEFNGGSYTGLGELRPIGTATVAANTTVNVGTYNMDGGGGSTLNVNSGVTFTLNVSAIEDTPLGTYGGTLNLPGGTLAVNNLASWGMEGTVNMTKPGAPVPTIGGTAEILHTGTGVINSAGGGTISAPYRFGVTPTVNVTSSTLLVSGTFSSNAGATLSKTGAGTLRVVGAQTHGAGATINVNGGNLLMETNADPSGVATNLRITTNPTGTATFNASQRLDSLIIANNSSATLAAAGNRFVYTHTLSITGTGFLELNDNDAIIDYAGGTPMATIRGYLVSGYNAGNWNGVGIRSNAAFAQINDLTALALAENSLLGFASFDGQIVDATALIIKYTYYGDSNFNGKIDSDDFALADKGLSLGLTGWVYGDYNYSGSVTLADIALLDKSFLLQSGTLAPDFRAYIAGREAQYGAEYAAQLLVSVPEPAVGALSALVLPVLARRRRRPASGASETS